MNSKEKCPGEDKCLNSVDEGVIRYLAGETLESYCHPKEGGCPLYFTKFSAIPLEFLGLLDAANRLRERKLGGRLPSMRVLEAWRWEAYLTTEYARRVIEQERAEEDLEESKNSTPQGQNSPKMQPVRGNMKDQIRNSDSGAFAISDDKG